LYAGVEPQPGRFDKAYLSSIQRTVDVLADHHIYSLLDFHQDQLDEAFGGEGFPAWSVDDGGVAPQDVVFPLGYTASPALNAAYQNFWDNVPGPGGIGLQQRYAAAWKAVASRFTRDPWVLGYDLFNEPWPPGVNGGAVPTAKLASFYRRVIASIRSVDDNHLVFYEPWVLFNFDIQTTLGKLGDRKLAMSYHDYCYGPDTAPSCPASEAGTIANAIAHADATGDGLVLSEFGAGTDLANLTRIANDADAGLQSWIEWAYCGCDDPTGSEPPAAEALVLDPEDPPSGSNVEQAKLTALVRVYATAIAGTPLSMSFDPTTRVFHLRYSTRPVARGTTKIRSCTLISAPRSVYPGGYVVRAVGARIGSTAGSPVIALRARPRAQVVSVTVSPARSGRTARSAAPENPPAPCR
ncbi:MAG: cellulase family glycosylhydrolase, partial [Acidimicrobiales bacterium]